MPPPKSKDQPRGTISGSVLSGLVCFTLRAVPLPEPIQNYLVQRGDVMRRISLRREDKENFISSLSTTTTDPIDDAQYGQTTDISQSSSESDLAFWTGLEEVCKGCADSTGAGVDFSKLVGSIWAFGPKRSGPNLLLDRMAGSVRSLRRRLNQGDFKEDQELQKASLGDLVKTEDGSIQPISWREFDDSIETAFQLATFKGPLCAEPMLGMCFSIERLELNTDDLSSAVETIRSKWSQLTGELISSMQEAFRSAMLDWSPRLMFAMYTCEIQATTEVLGKVYGVIARRKGIIKSEEIKDGTTFYTIGAKLPIIESFGFNDELMKKTSGIALPQLIFDGFQTFFDQDPFWIPKTEEELEDFGSIADKENLARKYMDQVRKRKGMFVEKKIVQHAEKQRTMKR